MGCVEFSAENILGFVEITQFCDVLTTSKGEEKEESSPTRFSLVYKEIPKSSIVFDDVKERNSRKMRKLCEKYVLVGAQFELNISHSLVCLLIFF